MSVNMKVKNLTMTREGKYLNSYVLDYESDDGHKKSYEFVSHRKLNGPEDIGNHVSGVSMCVIKDGRLLLLKEFRMAVNRFIYGMCAGMWDEGEELAECMKRELYEETGLKLKRVLHVLPPSFAAVSMSDIKNQIAIVEAEGEIADHATYNENISAAFYDKDEVRHLIDTAEFSSRAQVLAYFYTEGCLDKYF